MINYEDGELIELRKLSDVLNIEYGRLLIAKSLSWNRYLNLVLKDNEYSNSATNFARDKIIPHWRSKSVKGSKEKK